MWTQRRCNAICVYFIAAIGLFVISVLLVALDGFDLVTTFSAVAATFNNIGPALGVAGPTEQLCRVQRFFQSRDDDGYAAGAA